MHESIIQYIRNTQRSKNKSLFRKCMFNGNQQNRSERERESVGEPVTRERRAEELFAVESFHVVLVKQMRSALLEFLEARRRGGRPARSNQVGKCAIHLANEELRDCLVVAGPNLLDRYR